MIQVAMHDDHDDELLDDLEEEFADDEAGADEDLMACPACGKAVHEDTQQCPHCGDWITPVDPRGAGMRWIWMAAALLVIASMILLTVL